MKTWIFVFLLLAASIAGVSAQSPESVRPTGARLVLRQEYAEAYRAIVALLGKKGYQIISTNPRDGVATVTPPNSSAQAAPRITISLKYLVVLADPAPYTIVTIEADEPSSPGPAKAAAQVTRLMGRTFDESVR
jgi:hypothetical protein